MLKAKQKQIAAILLVAIGVGMLCLDYYIRTQVEEGNMQISAGQEKVDTVKRPFSLTPVSKPVGNVLTGSAQTRIDMGRDEVAHYEMMAHWLQIGGVIALVLGGGLWAFDFFKKK